MKKIMIIGCGGSGKSTLARQLHQRTGLPLIHLDQIFWKPGWVETKGQEWIDKNRELIKKESWIIDGNYGSTMDMRMEKADAIVFMDTPTCLRLWRVVIRYFQYRGKIRSDLTAGCPEKLDAGFLHYILLYNKTRRPGILQKLKKWGPSKKVFVLRNRKEVQELLEGFSR